MMLSTAEIKLTDFWMGSGMLWVQSVYMTTAECVLMSSRPQRGDTPVVMSPASCGELKPLSLCTNMKVFHPPTPETHRAVNVVCQLR